MEIRLLDVSQIFRRKIKIFDILRNLVWTRLYWVRAGRVRWKL